jgi:hypothetical protein
VRHFPSIYVHTTHFDQHTEIKLKDVPNRVYTLILSVENVDRQLQKTDNPTWTPVQRLYVPYFLVCMLTSELVCVEIFLKHAKTGAGVRMQSGR